jgi:hypothetical protein
LKHDADAALFRRNKNLVSSHHPVTEPDRALARRFEARDKAQKRGLAATGWAEKGGKGAWLEIERHAVERNRGTEATGKAIKANGGQRKL